MTRILKRTELYELVWTQPLIRIAADLGFSDVALLKICRKHSIPTPRAGHWAKVAAGRPVVRKALPKTPNAALELIKIRGSRPRSAVVLEAEDRSRELGVQKSQTGSLAGGSASSTPHIERLRARLGKARPGRDGFIRIWGKQQFALTITPACVEQGITLLERITDEALARSYALKPSENGLSFEIEGELIGFTLTEPLERVRHQPTEAETRRLARWEENYRRQRKSGQYVSTWDRPEIPEFDHVPSGKLAFEFNQHRYFYGLRRRFADGKRQRLDNLTARIVTTAAGYAAAAIEGRAKDARRQREQEEWERRRKELDRQRRLEVKRWEFLESRMKKLDIARKLEQFVADYRDRYSPDELSESCRRLLDWATAQADEIRMEVHPHRLAAKLDEHQLMDDRADIGSWVHVDD